LIIPRQADETTLATLTTSLPPGNNLVVAVVQLTSTAPATISAGSLTLKRDTTILRSNAYPMALSSNPPNNQKWWAAVALDSNSPASPSYSVTASASDAGISGEAKIVVLSGVSGSQIQGSSTAIGGAETTLATLTTSLPPGAKIIIAVVETSNTAGTAVDIDAAALKLKTGTATLTSNEFRFRHSDISEASYHTQMLLYLHTSAPASPTYTIAASASQSGVYGRATIAAITIDDTLSAAYVDGVSTRISTSDTILGSVPTTFSPGGSVIVIAPEQFKGFDKRRGTTSAAGNNRLQQNSATTGQTSNEFTLQFPVENGDDDGKGFSLLNRFTNIPSSPSYRVLAKNADNVVKGETKILAIRAGLIYTQDVAETLAGSETLTRTSLLTRAQTDSFTTSETINPLGNFKRDLGESLGVVASPLRHTSIIRLITDSQPFLDIIFATRLLTVAEALSLTDSAFRSTALFRNLSEGLSLSALGRRIGEYTRPIGDLLTLLANPSKTSIFNRLTSVPIEISDSVLRRSVLTRAISDLVETVDSALRGRLLILEETLKIKPLIGGLHELHPSATPPNPYTSTFPIIDLSTPPQTIANPYTGEASSTYPSPAEWVIENPYTTLSLASLVAGALLLRRKRGRKKLTQSSPKHPA